MDPLSITSGCVGIMGAIVKTSSTIREFVRDVRESRSQLGGTAHQLAELEMTISLVKDDHNAENGSFADHMPESVTRQTATVIQSCRDVLDELDTTMDKYNPRKHRTPLKWAFKGKDEVAALNKQLEAHPRTLQISLEISTLVMSKSIKADTAALGVVSGQIQDDTQHIRDDTGKILGEIDELRGLVLRQLPDHVQARIDILGNYLDSLTEYAETAVDPIDTDDSPHPHDTPPSLTPRSDADEVALRAGSRNSPSSHPPNADSTSSPNQGIQDAFLPRTYVNTEPIPLFLLGPTQNGKTAFLNRLMRLAYDVNVGVEGDGTAPCTFDVTVYDLAVPLSNYVLVDNATGEEVEPSVLCSLTSCNSWRCIPRSNCSVRLRIAGAPYVKLRLIDTPGFDDSRGVSDRDPLHSVLNALTRLGYSTSTWDMRSCAVALVYSSDVAFAYSFDTYVRSLSHYMRPPEWPSMLIHTNWKVNDFGIESDNLSSSLKERRSEAYQKLLPGGRKNLGQFFIDSRPETQQPGDPFASSFPAMPHTISSYVYFCTHP